MENGYENHRTCHFNCCFDRIVRGIALRPPVTSISASPSVGRTGLSRSARRAATARRADTVMNATATNTAREAMAIPRWPKRGLAAIASIRTRSAAGYVTRGGGVFTSLRSARTMQSYALTNTARRTVLRSTAAPAGSFTRRLYTITAIDGHRGCRAQGLLPLCSVAVWCRGFSSRRGAEKVDRAGAGTGPGFAIVTRIGAHVRLSCHPDSPSINFLQASVGTPQVNQMQWERRKQARRVALLLW